MSGLSIGKNRASRFCQATPAFAMPAKTRSWGENLGLVDGLLEALAGSERGQRLRRDADLFAVHGTSAGARLAPARQEGAEAHDRHALSLGDILDDGVEHRIHRLARGRLG